MKLIDFLYALLSYVIATTLLLLAAVTLSPARAEVKLEQFFTESKYKEAYGQAYVHGLMTGMVHGRSLDLTQVCFPTDREIDEMTAMMALAKHLDDHPEDAGLPLAKAMFKALSRQFNCSSLKRARQQ